MNCSRVTLSLVAAGSMAAAIILTDVTFSVSPAKASTYGPSVVVTSGCKHRKLLSNRLFGRRCCYTVCPTDHDSTSKSEPRTARQPDGQAVRSDWQHSSDIPQADYSGADPEAGQNEYMAGQDDYQPPQPEQTDYAVQPWDGQQGRWDAIPEDSQQMTGQSWDDSQPDAEHYSTEDSSYEAALRQTTDQFDRYNASGDFVAERWAAESAEAEQNRGDQWHPESNEAFDDQQTIDQQQVVNEDQMPNQEQVVDQEQMLDQQPNQQWDEQPAEDDSPQGEFGNQPDPLPANDAMPDAPDTDSSSQDDPYRSAEEESYDQTFAASESADSADATAQTERDETAVPETQYGNWEDPEAGIPEETRSETASDTAECVAERSAEAGENLHRYEYEYCPSESESESPYQYSPSEPAYGAEHPAEGQDDDDSASGRSADTAANAWGEPADDSQLQPQADPQYQPFGMDDDSQIGAEDNQPGAEDNQPGCDQWADDTQDVPKEEAADVAEEEASEKPAGQDAWIDGQSYGWDDESGDAEEQSDQQQSDDQQMQSDGDSSEPIPYQELPYDVSSEQSSSAEQGWQSPCPEYWQPIRQSIEVRQIDQTYQYDYTYDDFRADDPNFKPYVPPEVTNNQPCQPQAAQYGQWQPQPSDEPGHNDSFHSQSHQWDIAEEGNGALSEEASEAAADSDHRFQAEQLSEQQYIERSGDQWDAGYGKYNYSTQADISEDPEMSHTHSDYQPLEGYRHYADRNEDDDLRYDADAQGGAEDTAPESAAPAEEPMAPTEESADESFQPDSPSPDDSPSSDDEQFGQSNQSNDQQIDSADEGQWGGGNDGTDERLDDQPQNWADRDEPTEEQPAIQQQTEDAVIESEPSQGWVPATQPSSGPTPTTQASPDGDQQRLDPLGTDSQSDWMPLPNFRYPASPTSTEFFLPPDVQSEGALNYLGRQ